MPVDNVPVAGAAQADGIMFYADAFVSAYPLLSTYLVLLRWWHLLARTGTAGGPPHCRRIFLVERQKYCGLPLELASGAWARFDALFTTPTCNPFSTGI